MIANAAIRYFGDYLILDEIARGGMGVVYRARQISLGREVAVKLINAGNLASPGMVQRFYVEAEAMAQLDHPHIIPVYEVGQHEGQHYLAMKLAEGGSLADQLAGSCALGNAPASRGGSGSAKPEGETGKQRPTPRTAASADIANFAIKIARAIHHAHQRGVIHRDLKPANILLDAQGEPLVADFGLAKVLDSELGLTQSTAAMGTPHYMPPEQALGRSALITTAADVYSLGAILYELATGQPPFTGETRDAVLQKVIHEPPPQPRISNADVPRDLETITLKCLEKDPLRRYRTAEELAEDLDAWSHGRPIEARPVALWERTIKWIRRKPALATLILVACIGVGGIFWQWQEAEHARRLADESLAQFREAVARYLTVIAANPRNKPSDPAFLREELFQVTVSFLENFTRFRSVDPTLDRQRGLAYVGLGRVQNERGQSESAMTNAIQGRMIFEGLSQAAPGSALLRSDLANVDLVLGGILLRGTNQIEAEQTLLRALNQWHGLTNTAEASVNARRQLANTCNRLADLYRRMNRPDDAIEIQRQGLAVREALVLEFPRAWDERLNAAIDCSSLGLALASAPVASAEKASAMISTRSAKVTSDVKRLRESISVYAKGIKLYDQLVHERPEDEAARSSLALGAWSFGNLLGSIGSTNQALQYLEKALTNYQTLAAQFPQKPGYAREVENTRAKMDKLRPPAKTGLNEVTP